MGGMVTGGQGAEAGEKGVNGCGGDEETDLRLFRALGIEMGVAAGPEGI